MGGIDALLERLAAVDPPLGVRIDPLREFPFGHDPTGQDRVDPNAVRTERTREGAIGKPRQLAPAGFVVGTVSYCKLSAVFPQANLIAFNVRNVGHINEVVLTVTGIALGKLDPFAFYPVHAPDRTTI